MKIALAQLNPLVGDLEGNAKKIINSSIEAGSKGAELVLTPELSLWGYPPKDLLFNSSLFAIQEKTLSQIAETLSLEMPNLSLLIGIAEQCNDRQLPKLFNSVALIKNNSWRIVARKQLLPSYDVFDEKRYFRTANMNNIIDVGSGSNSLKIGITICEDLWVEEKIQGKRLQGPDPVEKLLNNSIELLVNLSASPFSLSKDLLRQKLAQKAAKRLGCPIIYLNQVGANDELIFDGSSFIMKANGDIDLSLPKYKESLDIWDMNNSQSQFTSISMRAEEKLFRSLVLGVQDYAKKCGFKSALLGLSGGIDSALVATIASAALGADKITSILMPSPWSSIGSIKDSEELAKRLGMYTKTIPIESLINIFEDSLTHTLGESPKDVTAENLQSRIRGTLLMAIANQQSHLLLSTGNKSELAVGYCTLYGDMNGGLAVIGDLYKTSVFKLSEWIDSKDSYKCRYSLGLKFSGEIIGEKIRTKPPSAELRPGQLDSDSLPEYKTLDPILKALIEDRLSTDDLICEGYDENLINKIQILLKKAEFKRLQAPPLLKISNQAFGSGWRVPIAAK